MKRGILQFLIFLSYRYICFIGSHF
jgi:hypothetical protein